MAGGCYTALLVVDVQNAMMADRPYGARGLIANLRRLIARCREGGPEIIYIRHDGGPGSPMERGSPGWQIYRPVAPMEGEPVFDKRFNSAFRDTGLREYLDSSGIRRLILTGMQTEYCIDTTCKVAFEYGYEVVLPRGATTTYDTAALTGKTIRKFYEERVWDGRFASVPDFEEFLRSLY